MRENQEQLPKWILIVSGIIALMELMVSILLCVSPQDVLESVDLQAIGVNYIIQMWSARQFALGIIFAFATYKKSTPMLTLAYVFFLVMFFGDLLIGITQNNSGLILSAIIMIGVSLGVLFVLKKHK